MTRRLCSLTLPVFAGGLAICALVACEESLPPFETPEVLFQARIIAYDLVVDPGEGVIPSNLEFAVDVENVYDPYLQYVLEPPFDMKVAISVFIESDPSRNCLVERSQHFNGRLEPGETVRVKLPFPVADRDGLPWSMGTGTYVRRDLILIGMVHIPQVCERGIDIPTDRKRIRFYNPFP